MKDFYITLLSSDSINYFPSNSLSAFTNQFNGKYELNENWVVGLAEMSYNRFDCHNTIDIDEHELMYAYVDIIKPTQIGFSQVRCIRLINTKRGEPNSLQFQNIQYHALDKTKFDNISILLANESGEKIEFHNNIMPTFVVLHFLKNK